MTDHQLTVAGFCLDLLALLGSLYVWSTRKLDLSSKKQMTRDLANIAELGERRYAELQVQKMRACFGIGGYLFCLAFVVPRVRIQFLDILFPSTAAMFFLFAGGYSKATTLYGVKKRIKEHRKALGLPEEPPKKRSGAA